VPSNEQALQLLSQVELFEGLSKAELRKIHGLSKELTFAEGENVITQQGKGGRFYLVTDGEAEIRIDDRDLKHITVGDYFGEMSLIDGEPRSATVKATTPLRTLTIASFNFRPLLLEHPTIAYKLLMTLSRRVRDLERQLG
jgi:CRP/FNR family transcriptional regulator, cyclic AMP receptor protein